MVLTLAMVNKGVVARVVAEVGERRSMVIDVEEGARSGGGEVEGVWRRRWWPVGGASEVAGGVDHAKVKGLGMGGGGD